MEEDVQALVKAALQEHLKEEGLSELSKDPGLQLTSLDGGYLNHVIRVTSSDGSRSCVVKVFLNYAKFLGPSASLETDRAKREHEASVYFRSLIPRCCPAQYFWDSSRNIVCMQDLIGYQLWGDSLKTSCDLQIGAKVADMLVSLHSLSHKLKVDDMSSLEEKFSSFPKQSAFFDANHFVKPFCKDHRQNKACDETVRAKMDEITQDAVVTKATELARSWMQEERKCCIHADCHVGSFMINGDGSDIKLIDTECTRVGPEAYDVAMLVSNYVLLYHYHQELAHQQAAAAADTEQAKGETPDLDHDFLRVHILDLICITLSRYMEGMNRALGEKFDKHKVWRQILLYMGVWIIAWISGPATLSCLDSQPLAQLNCLNTALRILHKQSLSLDAQDLSKLIHNQG